MGWFRDFLRAKPETWGEASAWIRGARRLVIGLVGSTVLLFGIALLVLPGPAVVVIPMGLAILALEFVWARRWLARFRASARRMAARWTTSNPERDAQPSSPETAPDS